MNYRNISIKREFIKSAAVLVLALILLVTAVVAWFANRSTSEISDFPISIETDDGGVYLGDSVVIKRSVVLPCATKFDEIESSDFSKAIYIETFEIKANTDVKKAEITVTTEDSPNLHYYIIANYNPDRDYAAEIKEFTEDVDIKCNIGFGSNDVINNQYQRTVAVVFWADYNAETEAAIKSGKLDLSATVKFTAK